MDSPAQQSTSYESRQTQVLLVYFKTTRGYNVTFESRENHSHNSFQFGTAMGTGLQLRMAEIPECNCHATSKTNWVGMRGEDLY